VESKFGDRAEGRKWGEVRGGRRRLCATILLVQEEEEGG